MKNFNNYTSRNSSILSKQLLCSLLFGLLVFMPAVLHANYVSLNKTTEIRNTLLEFDNNKVKDILWSAIGITNDVDYHKVTEAKFDGGDFSLDFVASSPNTYDHSTGGGAFDTRDVGQDTGDDIVESLEGGDFTCGDIVTFLTQIVVDKDAVGSQTIDLDYEFLADATGQSGVALADIVNVQINYGAVSGGDGVGSTDSGIKDDGGSVATLSNEHITGDGELFNDNKLVGTVTITDLEASEEVIVRVDVRIACDPTSSPTGNLQAAITAALVIDPEDDVISVGNQTVPFKNVNQIIFPTCAITPATAVCELATTSYTASSDVADATFVWSITGDGTIVDAASDGTKTIVASGGATSTSVSVLAGSAGSYTLSVSISKTGFGTQTCSQEITVNDVPTVTAGADQTVCAASPIQTLTATATVSTGATLVWYDAASGGNTVANPTLSSIGTATYYAQANLGDCSSGRVPVVLTINETPTVTAGADQTVCAASPIQTLTATATVSTGATLVWYDAASGGN
ncbi:Ig-like domain-containing protein, partial [Pontibacter fetidus]|nr:hypothetical protein [Pontibacter fetidus]